VYLAAQRWKEGYVCPKCGSHHGKDFTHEHKTYNPDSGLLHWLHIMVGNVKAFLLGTYHGLPKGNLQSYLDEFCFRFSRRSFGTALLDRLALAIAVSNKLS